MIAVAAAAAFVAGLAVVAAGRPRRDDRRRLATVLSAGSSPGAARPDASGPAPPVQPRPPARIAAAAAVLVLAVATVHGAVGVVIGLLAATGVAIARPRRRASTVRPDEVPILVDLLAGCLDAGATMPAALDAAAVAVPATMADRCQVVATALRAGAAPAQAWQGWLSDPWLSPVARTAVRTAHTGAAAAGDLRRTAGRLRARRRAAAQERLRRASIWLVVPLGLCFLPAFVLVAVVPLVAGLLPALR
jgi:pilus assembly protein TadC